MKSNFFVINSKKYDLIEIIHKSQWKKTQVLKLYKGGVYYVAKCISKDSPTEVKSRFFKEVEFYKTNQGDYLPKYIESCESTLIIEFIAGKALREVIKNNAFYVNYVEMLMANIERLYNNSKSRNTEINNYNNAFAHLSSLLQSGPIQALSNKTSFYKKMFNKVLLLILKAKLAWYLININNDDLMSGFVHGDLHYNNIIIDKNNNIKFIDFENIRYNGSFDFDLMYLFAMIEINVDSRTKEHKLLADAINKLCKNKWSKKIYTLFKYSISFNNRFDLQA